MTQEKLTDNAIALLKKLIETQSFSSEEEGTASHIENWFGRLINILTKVSPTCCLILITTR